MDTMTLFSNQIIASSRQLWSLKFLQAMELSKRYLHKPRKILSNF